MQDARGSAESSTPVTHHHTRTFTISVAIDDATTAATTAPADDDDVDADAHISFGKPPWLKISMLLLLEQQGTSSRSRNSSNSV